jgi:Leucine-rich repeat (LRR) protein
MHLHIKFEISSELLEELMPQMRDLEFLDLNDKKAGFIKYMPGSSMYFAKQPISLSCFSTLYHLRTLDLGHVQLTKGYCEFPDIEPLSTLPMLTKLSLRNYGWLLVRDLSPFKHLRELDLSFNEMKCDIPVPPLGSLSTLVVLNLSHTNMNSFCDQYSCLTNLEDLNLANATGGGAFHLDLSCLAPLTKLKKLNVSGTSFTSDSIEHLTPLQFLEEIDVSENTVYPRNYEQLGKMVGLNRIYLTLNSYFNSESLKKLKESGKKIVVCESKQTDEDTREMDLEGLVTSEDFINYNSKFSRGW